MAFNKFLKFENSSIRLNNDFFPAENISINLGASIQQPLDINGRMLNSSPNGPIRGNVSFSFDLTGRLPDYFFATGLSEEPTLIAFNTVVIYGHLENLSYSVEPYQPIKVDANFAFFHGIKFLNTWQEDNFTTKFDNRALSYNGARSYLIGTTESEFVPISFTYSLNAKRVPYTRVGFESPTRVALEDVTAEMDITSNNIDRYMSIRGNRASFRAVLNDLHNPTQDNEYALSVDGQVVDQSFDLGAQGFGVSKIKIIQKRPKSRQITHIPFIENTSLFTTTADRVYEAPDFTVVCPGSVRANQIIEGGTNNERGILDKYNLDVTFYVWYNVYIQYDNIPGCSFTDRFNRAGVNTQIGETFYDLDSSDEDRKGYSFYRLNGVETPMVVANLDLTWPEGITTPPLPDPTYKYAGLLGFFVGFDNNADGRLQDKLETNRLLKCKESDLSHFVPIGGGRADEDGLFAPPFCISIEAFKTVAFSCGWVVLNNGFDSAGVEIWTAKIYCPGDQNDNDVRFDVGNGTYESPYEMIVVPSKVADGPCPFNNCDDNDAYWSQTDCKNEGRLGV